MSLEQVPMYRVICDRCGTSAQEDGDYYAWADAEQAEADADDWLLNDGGHWCPGCVIAGDDGDPVPNPAPVTP